jgi:hypothetical protein
MSNLLNSVTHRISIGTVPLQFLSHLPASMIPTGLNAI